MIPLAYKLENNTIQLTAILIMYKYIPKYKANLRKILLKCHKWAQ